ncbi:MAG: DUF421 domain-containing protein [Actinomycetota bacterium]|nr:DUF421 domain-containing protein [Actinomycetota bacterium]
MQLVLRATVIYLFLWMLARGVGKRELSQMTAFELILLVVMGDLIQQGVTGEDMSVTGAIIVLSTLAFWIIVMSYLSFRFKATRSVFEGLAVVVIRDGEPVDEVLRVERVTLDEVKEEARSQGISSLRDVRLGVLEPDGKFSFLTQEADQRPQPDEKKVT